MIRGWTHRSWRPWSSSVNSLRKKNEKADGEYIKKRQLIFIILYLNKGDIQSSKVEHRFRNRNFNLMATLDTVCYIKNELTVANSSFFFISRANWLIKSAPFDTVYVLFRLRTILNSAFLPMCNDVRCVLLKKERHLLNLLFVVKLTDSEHVVGLMKVFCLFVAVNSLCIAFKIFNTTYLMLPNGNDNTNMQRLHPGSPKQSSFHEGKCYFVSFIRSFVCLIRKKQKSFL